jgi:hypothetical protein
MYAAWSWIALHLTRRMPNSGFVGIDGQHSRISSRSSFLVAAAWSPEPRPQYPAAWHQRRLSTSPWALGRIIDLRAVLNLKTATKLVAWGALESKICFSSEVMSMSSTVQEFY